MKLIIHIITDFRFAKALAFLWLICFWMPAIPQTKPSYSFYVAGHAYGAHAGKNVGLHPPFLNKLAENNDSNLMAVFLTGDIVNISTTASWNQVENELSQLGMNSYYIMGNHDNNSVGQAVFKKKHGGAYYSFVYENELFIVLNSTESDRSISSTQLDFLDDVFSNTDAHWERAFIFFHEVIWNSHEKYRLVRSNSRSRYAQLVNISNFWNAVYPRLKALPEKKFYLFAGDVGGNPDAIAASFDRWGNVTLLTSGMGEVKDENYLKVEVLHDTVTFQLIPLNKGVEMKPVNWYNIPEKPDSILGPVAVLPLQTNVIYRVLPIENATSYRWKLSSGISGNSDSSAINLQFDEYFRNGEISVTAINDGFGESDLATLQIFTDDTTFVSETKNELNFEIHQNQNTIQVTLNSDRAQNGIFQIYDLTGKIILNDEFSLNPGFNSEIIDKNVQCKGFMIAELKIDKKRSTQKIILF